jgi:hypothetical protein
MPTLNRVSLRDGEFIGKADSIDGAFEVVKARYAAGSARPGSGPPILGLRRDVAFWKQCSLLETGF